MSLCPYRTLYRAWHVVRAQAVLMALNGTEKIPTEVLPPNSGDLSHLEANDKLVWPRLERLSCHKAPKT